MPLGLRDFHFSKTSKLKHNLSNLYWEIRYAWQRAWRGYADPDVFDLDSRLAEHLIALLKDYKAHLTGLWAKPENPDVNPEDNYYTEEEIKEILNKIIYHLERSQESYWYEQNPEGSLLDYWNAMVPHKDKAFELLAKYYYNLWD